MKFFVFPDSLEPVETIEPSLTHECIRIFRVGALLWFSTWISSLHDVVSSSFYSLFWYLSMSSIAGISAPLPSVINTRLQMREIHVSSLLFFTVSTDTVCHECEDIAD